MFRDRKDAGQKLGTALLDYKEQDPLVLGIARGGVEVGFYVAECLEADFSVLVVRKLPFPDNAEVGFGAIAEDGSIFLIDYAERYLSPDAVKAIMKEQSQEIRRRVSALRRDRPLPPVAGRTVVLVDDGIAVGSTMRAAIMLCKNQEAREIVVGSPVAGPSTAADIDKIVDEAVILEKPVFFHAVAQIYSTWHDVSDDEVIQIMDRWQRHKQ
jgi:predicted phosphoribosyltransferase